MHKFFLDMCEGRGEIYVNKDEGILDALERTARIHNIKGYTKEDLKELQSLLIKEREGVFRCRKLTTTQLNMMKAEDTFPAGTSEVSITPNLQGNIDSNSDRGNDRNSTVNIIELKHGNYGSIKQYNGPK